MNWDDLKMFLAVAEAPSMRLAAKGLKVSHSTVSRRIESLEKDLGVRLFDRLPDGYRLTRSGEELLPVALQTDEKLHSYGRHVAGRDAELKGQVCVTAPDVVASSYFMPYFKAFMEEYPDIQLKVHDSFEVFDLSRREADVAIRLTDQPPEHLIGRKLGTLHQAVYATPEYLAEHDPYAANSRAKWVGWGSPEHRPSWIEQSPFPHLGVVGHFNNMQIQHRAVCQNMGLGFFPCVQGDADPGLVRIGDPVPLKDVWLLSHRDLRAAARMRAFRQFMFRHQIEISAALEGRVLEPVS